MMSFVSDRPAPGQVDPSELTAGQLAALRTIAEYRMSRVKGGWQAPGSPRVTLPTAQYLGHLRLVMRRVYNGRERLEATATGRNTLAVADQRRQRRAQ
jgi:hypothetical protein